MRLTVFGATGGTGREIVRQAREAGYDVTVVVRGEPALDGFEGCRVVTADVTDTEAIKPALDEADVAISALGPRSGGPSTILNHGTRAITQAMTATDVKRLVVMSMAPVTTAGDGFVTRTVAKPILRRALRHARDDSINMEDHLRSTDLDWTIVRPPLLTNGKRVGRYRTAHDANVKRGFVISRKSVAAAILDLLEDQAANRAAVGVAN